MRGEVSASTGPKPKSCVYRSSTIALQRGQRYDAILIKLFSFALMTLELRAQVGRIFLQAATWICLTC